MNGRDARTSPQGQDRPDAVNGSGRFTVVGRTSEQARLWEVFVTAVEGHGTMVLLGGEAGIGKTTLARNLISTAQAQGTRILIGRCYEQAHARPYGPWLNLFENYHADESGPPPPTSLAAGRLTRVPSRAALFDDIRCFFAKLAQTGSTLVLLEDFQWSDPSSVEILRHLGSFLRHWPMLIVSTYRTEELSRHDPLYQHFPALLREADGISIQLRRLPPDAMQELVEHSYNLAAEEIAHLVRYLDFHADGNPFFAIELLRALEDDGLLRPNSVHTDLRDLGHVVVPPLLRQVIDGRVAKLGHDTRFPLEMASVIGQDIPLDLWAQLTKLDEKEMLDLVERAMRVHLLESDRVGTHVHFVHALTRAALYESILAPRRRMWHRQVAETIIANGDADPESVAVHFQLASDPRAVPWLIEAGDRARQAYAWITASARLRAAAALLQKVPGMESVSCDLIFRASHLIRFCYPDDAIAALDHVELLALELGDQVLAAEAKVLRGHNLCYKDRFQPGLAEIYQGLEILEDLPPDFEHISSTIQSWFPDARPISSPDALAADLVAVERLRQAGLDFQRCIYLWHLAAAGQASAAFEIGSRLVALLPRANEPRGGMGVALAFTEHGLGIALALLGQPNQARRLWEESRTLFEEVEHFALIAFTLLAELRDISMTYGVANPADRRALAARAEKELARTGGALRPGVSPRLAWLGCLQLDGEWNQVDRILRDLSPPGNSYLQSEITMTAANMARFRNEPGVAWQHIHLRLPDGPGTQPGDCIFQEGLALQRLACDLCLDGKNLDTAQQWLEAHDRWLRWGESRIGLAESPLAWARWHNARADLTQAATCARQALAAGAEYGLPLVELAASRLLGDLDVELGEFESAERHFRAALDLADCCELPYERSLTLLSMAVAQLTQGAGGAARRLLEQAREFCEQANATMTLAEIDALLTRIMVEPTPNPANLTDREIDVLRLLAARLTDKEIAEILFISHHTVSTHVKRILGKLDVADRRQAAHYAHDHGLVDVAT